MQELLVANVDVNATDSIGRGPLSYAARNDASDVAKVLIEAGADVEAADSRGGRPLHWAAEKNELAVVAKILIEAGADVETADDNGRRPLHWAAEKNASTVAKILTEAGADVETADDNGRRPLHWAAEKNALAVAKILIEAGADFETADDNGRRPLHWAAESGDWNLVAFLVRKGADLDVRDKDGLVALQLAERRGNIAVMRLLGENWSLSAELLGRHRAGRSLSSISTHFIREVADTLGYCSPEEDAVPAFSRDAPSAIQHLPIGHIFADKYRIDSRFLSRKGLSRTAVDVGTGQRVNLDFYTDPENLKKSLNLCNRLLESEGVCRLIEKIDAQDRLPDCLVVERGHFTLDRWIKTRVISWWKKLEALDLIAAALEELHGLGIVHADLNPANLTFFPSDRTWKLLNLDSAWSADHTCRPALTNIAYAAPELLKRRSALSGESECDPSVDMWSFGVIAFEILTGEKLNETQQLNRESMLEFIRTRHFMRRLNAMQDRSHKCFVKKLLKLDPSSRCTASEARNSSLLQRASVQRNLCMWRASAPAPSRQRMRF